ncbi:MAG: signal transduction histidine kinase [Sulfurimonas sp.]|jgi:signal transduction histidine kinase
MKRIILILILLLLPLFGDKQVTLQLNWVQQFQFAGYFAAIEQGYYKDVGIDVKIKPFYCNTNLSTVIKDGEADFAIGRSSLLLDKMDGDDIVAIGAIFQQSPLVLIVKEDSNITSIQDLINKRIMITNDAKTTASIMAMLHSKGVTKTDVHVLEHTFNLDDLINNNTDAMASYISNEPIELENKGIKYKIFNPKDYGFNFYSDILFTSSEFIKYNPTLTRDFYKATIKGWKYAFDNIAKTAELIHNKYNSNISTLHLMKEGEALRNLAYTKNGNIGHMDVKQLKEMMSVYSILGYEIKKVDLDSFIYEGNHPKGINFLIAYDDIYHILIITILSVASLIFGILYISLKREWLLTKSDLNKKIISQKEEIESQNRLIMEQSKIAAIGAMLSNIAHQWRQPLNIISLHTVRMETSILLDQDIEKEEILEISQDINRQSQYLSKTIDDFRNYFNSNINEVSTFNIKDTISKVNELTKDTFNANYIKRIVEIKECIITQNESLIIQALVNIYNNAKDAMLNNTQSQKYFFIEVKCNTKNVVITIKDSGGGIDESIIENIFEPYFTTKDVDQGTGLGLFITYKIFTKHLKGSIEVHNEEYEYDSQKLRGAVFVITIPK